MNTFDQSTRSFQQAAYRQERIRMRARAWEVCFVLACVLALAVLVRWAT